MNREELGKHGVRLKKQIAALASELDKAGRLKLKLELMAGGACESVARLLMTGDYDPNPRRDLIDNMEEVLAKLRKARAS